MQRRSGCGVGRTSGPRSQTRGVCHALWTLRWKCPVSNESMSLESSGGRNAQAATMKTDSTRCSIQRREKVQGPSPGAFVRGSHGWEAEAGERARDELQRAGASRQTGRFLPTCAPILQHAVSTRASRPSLPPPLDELLALVTVCSGS